MRYIIIFLFIFCLSGDLLAKKIPAWDKDYKEWTYEDCQSFYQNESPWKASHINYSEEGIGLVVAYWWTRLNVLASVRQKQLEQRLDETATNNLLQETLGLSGLSDSVIAFYITYGFKPRSRSRLSDDSFWRDIDLKVFLELDETHSIRPFKYLALQKGYMLFFLKPDFLTIETKILFLTVNHKDQVYRLKFECFKMRSKGVPVFN